MWGVKMQNWQELKAVKVQYQQQVALRTQKTATISNRREILVCAGTGCLSSKLCEGLDKFV